MVDVTDAQGRYLDSKTLDQLEELTEVADAFNSARTHLWGEVDEARRQGISWELIGRALGVTRQAAQKRFSKPCPGQLF